MDAVSRESVAFDLTEVPQNGMVALLVEKNLVLDDPPMSDAPVHADPVCVFTAHHIHAFSKTHGQQHELSGELDRALFLPEKTDRYGHAHRCPSIILWQPDGVAQGPPVLHGARWGGVILSGVVWGRRWVPQEEIFLL